jgi:homoserine dehydrogenase
MERINIGIVGFGTVGSGTVQILLESREMIANRVGSELVVKRIADLDIETDRGLPIPKGVLTRDAMEVIDDPDIRIVVELIGGTTKAKEFILAALKRGKHVVTANKALLAEHGQEIYRHAEENAVSLAFEASVGGSIPIIRSLKEGLSANRIKSIIGILNGTSNYILTRMTQDGLPYEKAVAEAIEQGFAEDPPDLDVNGTDAAHKLAILISIAFGVPAPFGSIFREGIDRLTPDDITFAGEFGYAVKLLAIARNLGDGVEARVHPAMVPLGHIMANVNGAFNAIYLEGDFAGPHLYYGQGAGKRPTGSAVVSDIIALARQIRCNIGSMMPPLAHVRQPAGRLELRPVDELLSSYYFRFSAVDRPGVLSKVSGVLGRHNISIYSVIQKGREKDGSVPIVMLTHEARERSVIHALKELDPLEFLTDKTMVIRVEEGKERNAS